MTRKPSVLCLSHAPEPVYEVVRACLGRLLELSFLETGSDGERATAALFHAFGTRGLYLDRAGPLPAGLDRDLGLTPVAFDTVLAQSDIVSIHLPLTEA